MSFFPWLHKVVFALVVAVAIGAAAGAKTVIAGDHDQSLAESSLPEIDSAPGNAAVANAAQGVMVAAAQPDAPVTASPSAPAGQNPRRAKESITLFFIGGAFLLVTALLRRSRKRRQHILQKF